MVEQIPGNARWVAMFAERLAAQAAPLHRGADAARDLDPAHWTGPASDAYALARPELPKALAAVADVHTEVRARFEGHNTFVHQLPHLLRDAEPDERARLEALFRTAAADVATFLSTRADALDGVLSEETAVGPAPRRAVPAPRVETPAPSPEERFAALVRDEVIAGTRTERLRWAV